MLTLSAATANRVIFPNRSPFLENLYFPVSILSFVLNPNLDSRSYRVREQAQELPIVLYYCIMKILAPHIMSCSARWRHTVLSGFRTLFRESFEHIAHEKNYDGSGIEVIRPQYSIRPFRFLDHPDLTSKI